jgi:hypothetical protein
MNTPPIDRSIAPRLRSGVKLVGAMVRLEVFDAQGRRVGMLANRYFPPGSHAVPWNPSAGGRRIGPGVYFYRLDAGAFHDRRKMTLIP